MLRSAAIKHYKNIDEYISLFAPEVQGILQEIRSTIRRAAPDAEETISYRMPAFRRGGIIAYFAAFKKHIGMYPPVRGDAKLEKAVARYAGEKGNLRFPLDQPIPYGLIERIVKFRVKQDSNRFAHGSEWSDSGSGAAVGGMNLSAIDPGGRCCATAG